MRGSFPQLQCAMSNWLRNVSYAGLALALLLGFFLVWLWQPARQVDRHTRHLLRKLEQRNWAAVANFIGPGYKDQWGDDGSLALERAQEAFGYLHGINIHTINPTIHIDNDRGIWRARIIIGGGSGDETTLLFKERVNSLSTPFELEWRRTSGRPWDWKLVYVSNRQLEIPPHSL
jgi:hypothetical protein